MSEKQMELNKETALRLWNKSFGKDTKVEDYTGRTIVKSAYNDRNSEYGWNVDHILPQSKGGKTADYNLICCHISTNDEKANKFPAFKANGITFEIIRVQNHYEIRRVSNDKISEVSHDTTDDIDFMDASSGIRFFKRLKGQQNRKRWVGSVYLRLYGLKNTALLDFIEEIFINENISYDNSQPRTYSYNNPYTYITIKNYDMPLKEDTEELLNKCVLLNIYLKHYFLSKDYLKGYDIYYRVDCFEHRGMFSFDDSNPFRSNYYFTYQPTIRNSLFINDLVIENTSAKDDISNLPQNNDYTEYDYTFTQLKKDLNRR